MTTAVHSVARGSDVPVGRRRIRDVPAAVSTVPIDALESDGALEAPLPPRITREQALHFAESLVRGEPDRVEIAKNAFGRKIRELV